MRPVHAAWLFGLVAAAGGGYLWGARRPPAPVPAPTPASSPAPSVAFERARGVVERGLRAGVWTEQDRDALREQMAGLSQDQAQQIFSLLFPALNEGRLRPTYQGAPL
jgi:hypothetical protein